MNRFPINLQRTVCMISITSHPSFWSGCRKTHRYEAKHPNAADLLQPLPEWVRCLSAQLLHSALCCHPDRSCAQFHKPVYRLAVNSCIIAPLPASRCFYKVVPHKLPGTLSQVVLSAFCSHEQCTEGIRSDQKNVLLIIPPFLHTAQLFVLPSERPTEVQGPLPTDLSLSITAKSIPSFRLECINSMTNLGSIDPGSPQEHSLILCDQAGCQANSWLMSVSSSDRVLYVALSAHDVFL